MNVDIKFTDEQLIQTIYKAAQEYENLVGKGFLFIAKPKKGSYYWFECKFEAKNFPHLLGIKAPNATEFYKKCCEYNHGNGEGITIADCKPSMGHTRKDINNKSYCAPGLFRIRDAKYMKVGDMDKMRIHIDFSYAYGMEATLGFKREKGISSYPISILPDKISEFTTDPQRITFVLERDAKDENKFCRIHTEKKKGLFMELYDEFPEQLKSRIALL